MTVDVEGLPRRNGELAFDAPWESRVFGLAAAVVTRACDGDWRAFRQQLMAAVAEQPDRPYWESWTAALEALLVDQGRLPAGALDALLAEEEGDLTSLRRRHE